MGALAVAAIIQVNRAIQIAEIRRALTESTIEVHEMQKQIADDKAMVSIDFHDLKDDLMTAFLSPRKKSSESDGASSDDARSPVATLSPKVKCK